MTVRRQRRASDEGFSLVELAVYIVILGIISAVVATVVVSLFQSEKTVSGITTSTSDSQNTIAFLSKDIRNARQFQSSSDGTDVIASVASSDPTSLTWQCVKWRVEEVTNVDPTKKRQYRVTREVIVDSAGSIWVPGTETTLIAQDGPFGTSKIFVGEAGMGALGSLQYSMQVKTTDKGVLDVNGRLVNTAQGAGATTHCF